MSKLYSVKIKRDSYSDITPYYWCYDKLGIPFEKWHAVSYSNSYIFYFKYKEDYTLFLLTWGEN